MPPSELALLELASEVKRLELETISLGSGKWTIGAFDKKYQITVLRKMKLILPFAQEGDHT